MRGENPVEGEANGLNQAADYGTTEIRLAKMSPGKHALHGKDSIMRSISG